MGCVNGVVAGVVLASGCAVHVVGFVEVDDEATSLLRADGRRMSLALLDEDAEPVAHLDAWLVEIDGYRRVRSTRVRSWRALEGPHGMAAWVGHVQSFGPGVALYDRNTQELYALDGAAATRLRGMPGALVAAEAWMVGPRALEVVHLAVLSP